MGRPRSEERPPGHTRRQLLDAGGDIFAENGYGASIQSIAARAGVTSATIYRHFDSKADLLLGVIDEAVKALPFARYLESCDEITRDSFAEMVSLYADPSMRRMRRLAIEVHAAASRDPDAMTLLLEFNRRVRREVAQCLATCIQRGLVSADLDVSRTSDLLFVTMLGLSHLDTFEPDLLGDERWIRFLNESIDRLLGD